MTNARGRFGGWDLRAVFDLLYPWFVALGVGLLTGFTPSHRRAFGQIQGDLFGGVLAFSGLLITVLLALLGVLVALDQKPIVAKLKKGRHYRQLVGLAREAVLVYLTLSVFAMFGFFFTAQDKEYVQRIITIGCCSLMALGLAETVRFSLHLVRVMTDPTGEGPERSVKGDVAAARERLRGDDETEVSGSDSAFIRA